MSKISFQLKEKFDVKPSVLYEAWLDSRKHSEMTGGEAICSNREGDKFTAWDGYISGRNIQLIPAKKIVQCWRTTEFDEVDEDSELILELNEIEEGCELILTHMNIPGDQPDYKEGWTEHYFIPMKEYFFSKK